MNGAIPVTLSDQELIRAGGTGRFFANRHAGGIRARGRRAGELLLQFDERGGDTTKKEGARLTASTQREAAQSAGMSEHTARRSMGVARQFEDKTSMVRDLDPTALYELAAPKTPLEVREEIEKMIYSQDRRTIIPDSIAAARNIAIASLGSVSPLIEPSQAWIAFWCIGPANGAQRLNRTFCATSLESTSHMRWVAGIFTRTGLGQWVSRSDMVSPPETLSNSAIQSLFPGGAA